MNWRSNKRLALDDLSLIGGTKGSVRLDFITSDKSIVYDLKFGKKGMLPQEIASIRVHGPIDAIQKEVRPSYKGGITQVYPALTK